VRPHPELDLVRHQVAQQRMDRPHLGELAEDQADHRLDLLIRIQGDVPRRPLDIPHRWHERQRAAARLGQQSLAQALLHDMEFGLGHGAL
jgi:hypothetical protein